jgi:hypothetical protein
MRLDVCDVYKSDALFRLFVQNYSAIFRLQRTDNPKRHARRQFIIEKRDVAGKYVSFVGDLTM